MSEINLNYVVEPTEIAVEVNTTELSFTPTPINLSFSTVGFGGGNTVPGGLNSWVQFNNADSFAGASGLTYNLASGTTTASILYVPTSANIANLTVNGLASQNTSEFNGATTFNSTANFNFPITISGNANVASTLSIQQGREKVVATGGSGGTIALDVTQGAIFNITGTLTGNVVLNFTNLSTLLQGLDANNKTVTITVLTIVADPAYIPTSIQINGISQSVLWLNGTSPSALIDPGYVFYTFTFMRTQTLLPAFRIWGTIARFA